MKTILAIIIILLLVPLVHGEVTGTLRIGTDTNDSGATGNTVPIDILSVLIPVIAAIVIILIFAAKYRMKK